MRPSAPWQWGSQPLQLPLFSVAAIAAAGAVPLREISSSMDAVAAIGACAQQSLGVYLTSSVVNAGNVFPRCTCQCLRPMSELPCLKFHSLATASSVPARRSWRSTRPLSFRARVYDEHGDPEARVMPWHSCQTRAMTARGSTGSVMHLQAFHVASFWYL